jgi:hypothetical protein
MTQSLSSKKIVCRKLLSKKSSSRKSSSRKSSSRDLLNQSNMMLNKKKSDPIYSFIFTIIINSIIIYYLINLEDVTCNCITDWRHNYIKYFSIFIILINTLMFIGLHIPKTINPHIIGSIAMVFLVLSILNMYALYTYVGDLNDTKCVCAVDKQKEVNTFLYYYRYIFIIMPILFIIGLIILLLILR